MTSHLLGYLCKELFITIEPNISKVTILEKNSIPIDFHGLIVVNVIGMNHFISYN